MSNEVLEDVNHFDLEQDLGEVSLPPGWSLKAAGLREVLVSPTGRQFPTRVRALQHLIRVGAGGEQIDEMRRCIAYEGFLVNALLPEGWRLKHLMVMEEGRVASRVTFLTREGVLLESFRMAGVHMKLQKYKEASINLLGELMEQLTVERRRQRGSLGVEINSGSEKRKRMKFHVVSDGSHFPSKNLALKFLISKSFPSDEVDALRSSLVEEGWKSDVLLPPNWRFKRSKHLQFTFLTPLADQLSGVQAAIRQVETECDKGEIENFRNFLEIQAVVSRSKKFTWKSDPKTLPEGWKIRTTGSKAFILSPDGQQFCSRKLCLQYMLREGWEEEEVEEMRRMCAHEGWTEHSLLPPGWIIQTSSKSSTVQIMSHLGEVFDSYRTAMTYMRRTDNNFGQTEVNQMLKLIGENSKPKSLPPQQLVKGNWTRDMALPEGWMVRREERQGVMVETFLTHKGQQVVSRISALEHMVKNGYSRVEMDQVRQGLKSFGWRSDSNLPSGFLTRYLLQPILTIYVLENSMFESPGFLGKRDLHNF